MIRLATIAAAAGLAGCATAVTTAPVYRLADAPPSEVRTEAEAKTSAGDWGTFYQYFNEDTPVLSAVNVGVAKIRSGGNEPHPPHKHSEEEYIIVLDGRGTWYLNGETFPAKKGDVLYAKSWDYHGIKSDPDSPLDFYIVKFDGKAQIMPDDPDPSMPLEIDP